MALSDRAVVLTPYVRQLLCDQDAQDAARRAVGATRRAYRRARSKDSRQALADKKLRRQLQEAVQASSDLWSAISEPPPRRKPRLRRRLAVLALGGAGVFLAVNSQARGRVLELAGAKRANPGQ
jgi:hypothetical protein